MADRLVKVQEKLVDLFLKVQNATGTAVEELKGVTVEDLKELGEKPEMLSEGVIVLIAIFAIVVGSSWSVGGKLRAKAYSKPYTPPADEEEDDEVHVSAKEAATFPIAGSMVLLSLYICYQLIPKELFNAVISLNFLIVSMYAVSQALYPIVKHGVLSGLIAVGLAVGWWFTGHFAINNLIALGLCVQSLWKIKLPSFLTAWVMLWGLFLYDIWWVFGTEVMVSVAKNIEAPVLLKMPKNLLSEEYKSNEMMLLGLGDIVIPGFFIALCLRYDYSRATNGPTRIYFTTAIVCYTLGLLNTILVMMLFKHAQPALLYLVPWITFGTLLMSILTLDTVNMFTYNDELPESQQESSEGSDAAKANNDDELTYMQAAYNVLVAELFHLKKIKAVPKQKAD